MKNKLRIFKRSEIKLMSMEIGVDWQWNQKYDLYRVTLKNDCIIENEIRMAGSIITFDNDGLIFKIN